MRCIALKQPTSMDDCVYFTRRSFDGKGSVMAWVSREMCPKCQKVLMGKPRDKMGKVKIRAKEYACPACNYTIPKDEYEDQLTCSIQYTCPGCGSSGELQVPFVRKKVRRVDEVTGKKETVDVIRFECQMCKQKIDITKKIK